MAAHAEEYDEEVTYAVIEIPEDVKLEAGEDVELQEASTRQPQLVVHSTCLNGWIEPIIGTVLSFQAPPAAGAPADCPQTSGTGAAGPTATAAAGPAGAAGQKDLEFKHRITTRISFEKLRK
ncbi:unnamed protein product [Phaeothamnion confervicola]